MKAYNGDSISSFYVAEKFACQISRVDLYSGLVYGFPVTEDAEACGGHLWPVKVTVAENGHLLVLAERSIYIMDEDGYFKALKLYGDDIPVVKATPDGLLKTATILECGQLEPIKNTSLYLFTDKWAGALRIIDTETETIRTICFRENRLLFSFPNESMVPTCNLSQPVSLLLLEDSSTLYIGTMATLWKTRLYGEFGFE